MAKICCAETGRELSLPEAYANFVDGSYNLEDNEATDDWRPVGRECVQPLRDRGVMLAGLLTPL